MATASIGAGRGGGGGAGGGGGLLAEALVRPSLKRGRLGMSLATGLVGTQENAFLGDFFGCMGFLPLTCQSTVREAMVRILFSSDNDNNKGFSSSTGHTWPHPVAPASAMMAMDEEKFCYGGGEGDMSIVSTARSPVSSMKQWEQQQQLSPSDPSTSMFWCAVALGALTQGRPVRSVAPYIRLAEAALVGNEEGAFSDAARAWTLMGYLYGFCGDSAKFRNCQEQAERCFHDGRTEGEDTSEEEAADATTASRLSQFVMQSYHRFGQAFFADVSATGDGDEASTALERAADASIEPAGFADAGPSAGGVLHCSSRSDELSELLCGGDDDDDDDEGDALLNIVHDFCANMSSANDASSAPAVVDSDVSASRGTYGRSLEERVHQKGEFVLVGSEAMTPPKHTSQNMQKVMMAALPEYERLEGAVDMPEVRGGIGGLMLNWLHISHLLIIMTATYEDRDLYTALMVAYNPMRPEGSRRIPPFEEWEGIGNLCSHVYCRYLQQAAAAAAATATAAAEAEAAAAWCRRSTAPPTAVTNSPCSADGAASLAAFSDDLDGATLCADMDPIVTPSMLGMRRQQAASLSSQMVPTMGGGLMVGGAPVAGTPPPASTVSSSWSSFATVFPNAAGPWEAGSGPPACSRGGFPGLGEVGGGGGGGSIDALDAVLNGDDDDDDDEDDGGSKFVQLDVLADLPEVKSTYLLSQAFEEAYDGKGNSSHNRGGGRGGGGGCGGNDRRHAEAAYRETEEALGKGWCWRL
ncbi:expressed unknown protein [Ectocarpus siliculosus]|uniref:Uncharacterized protein n=1 Tax=Ectocarpus siliculosus TaxID=2880 RepID=D7FTC5_ECTSI|nr:expressed unknown protein [Ectocarpus siliculosus]|eukprot:CBJ48503.1 expressed unknown protein [Ectocarpus siliculosus]